LDKKWSKLVKKIIKITSPNLTKPEVT
jgi:hypothetical protein